MKRSLIQSVVCLGLVACLYLALPDEAAGQESYPRTFTDANGHSVTLTAKPARIASGVLGVDENLLDLVDPSRIVTMTEISTNPGISNVAGRVPEGMTLIRYRWQDVVDANPDLVLVATYTPTLAGPLIERGLPVYQFSDFSNIDALLRNFETLGQLVGEEDEAEAILSTQRAELGEASQKIWPRPIRPIYYSEGFLVTAGTVPSELMGRAGLADAAAEFGQSLRWTADMIETGPATRVYQVALGSFATFTSPSFDTHSREIDIHRILYSEFSSGVRAFVEHMRATGDLSRVRLLTFSEFGRQAEENRGNGTDHGDASVMFLAGGKVRQGLLGKPADLGRIHEGGLEPNMNFRQI